ncbi:MAG: DNA mismatch repair protein MutS [Oscillospiraceae bacterium]|nr:DNA mismatch repair protein MutS [Oscillospiraceae bacterium]
MAKLSPMMEQYFSIKSKHQDQILFFRLGDFYEMFYDDAKTASRELELTLTGRDCGQEERAPMCGVPYHSCEAYIARLIKKGYKVAICEQMEDPALAKGLVKRDVIRVITPGTIVETSMLDESANNYIASIWCEGEGFGACFTDISTGELHVTEYAGQDFQNKLTQELGRFAPSEAVFTEALLDKKTVVGFIKEKLGCSATLMTEGEFSPGDSEAVVKQHFHVEDLSQLSLEDKPLCRSAVAMLLVYLKETQKVGLERLLSIDYYNESQFMNLDLIARRNLELTRTMRTGEKKGSLLWVLDKTRTAMGKRMMKSFLDQPLINPAIINKRLNAVEELYRDGVLRQELEADLAGVFDLDRLMTKVVFGSANPRDLKAIQATAERLPALREKLAEVKSIFLRDIYDHLDPLEDVARLISDAIREEPPVVLKDGGVIRPGYHPPLDELRDLVAHSKEYLAGIEAREKERTGIKTLRIGYNRVFGYYLEVSKSYADKVPADYIRKQTLTNGERYITEELKVLEEKILGASDQIIRLEQTLFDEVRTRIADQVSRTQSTSSAVARLDVFCSFASVARENNYARPEVNLSGDLVIEDGRHPVVEALLSGAPFVPNDTNLNRTDRQIAIITGPNMAGKSTYMRQVALIVLMAQIGSFVPASAASIGVVDGIYTRVGASDDLSSGQSTFMVEMNEVAYILRHATARSLLILDEIGRGTSTFDGMSIARAVLEYIADKKKLGAKTLFATHYHELTAVEEDLDSVKNYNIAVKKRGDDITFLRRIIPGGADDSYGIEVSKLAGIPDWVIQRAHEILGQLEDGQAVTVEKKKGKKQPPTELSDGQMTFLPEAGDAVSARLRQVDVNTLTPIEALNLLYELKGLL